MAGKVDLYTIEFEEVMLEQLKNKGFGEKIAEVSQEYINVIKGLALAKFKENEELEQQEQCPCMEEESLNCGMKCSRCGREL